ncbi:hypothetical protein [Isobaculum melis]|uniref:Uncharacterized protein n=1 Tax=Isobaculum melis TaxID=142588 RepID=A0A1H9PTV4_9LACT|nr:hypothetical protein [Isobaculum melis]SER51023.1 hypothetical protein SAMN04488559_101102 [Isobaculum melis]
MGFDVEVYQLRTDTQLARKQERIAWFHAFNSDPNISVLEELLKVFPPVKIADTKWCVEDFDGICSLENVKKAKAIFNRDMCQAVETNIRYENGIKVSSEMSDLNYPFEKISRFLDEIIKHAKTEYLGLYWG